MSWREEHNFQWGLLLLCFVVKLVLEKKVQLIESLSLSVL